MKRSNLLFVLAAATLCSAPGLETRAQNSDETPDRTAPRGHVVRRAGDEGVLPLRLRILQKLVWTKIDVNYDAAPAEDVFNHLRTVLNINLVARYSDDAVGFGIDPETPITLSLQQTPALEVLEMVLEQCSDTEACTWQLRRSFLEVGTKERLSTDGAIETRIYPVADLLFDAPNFDNAPTFRLEDELGYGYAVSPFIPGLHPHFRDRHNPSARPGRPGRGRGGGGVHPGGMNIGRGGFGGGVSIGNAPPGSHNPETEQERANDLIDLIVTVIEPQAWAQNGGTWASIAYRDGGLIVRAPDYIHRALQGEPNVPPPAEAKQADRE